jgi:hypothetical protein
VVARRPSSKPAAPSTNAPVQIEAIRAPRAAARAHRLEHVRGHGPAVVADARHDDRVRIAQCLEAVLDEHREPVSVGTAGWVRRP